MSEKGRNGPFSCYMRPDAMRIIKSSVATLALCEKRSGH